MDNLENLTLKQLMVLCMESGVNTEKAETKADLIQLLKSEKKKPSPPTPVFSVPNNNNTSSLNSSTSNAPPIPSLASKPPVRPPVAKRPEVGVRSPPPNRPTPPIQSPSVNPSSETPSSSTSSNSYPYNMGVPTNPFTSGPPQRRPPPTPASMSSPNLISSGPPRNSPQRIQVLPTLPAKSSTYTLSNSIPPSSNSTNTNATTNSPSSDPPSTSPSNDDAVKHMHIPPKKPPPAFPNLMNRPMSPPPRPPPPQGNSTPKNKEEEEESKAFIQESEDERSRRDSSWGRSAPGAKQGKKALTLRGNIAKIGTRTTVLQEDKEKEDMKPPYVFQIETTIPVYSSSEKMFMVYLVDIKDIKKRTTTTILKRYRQFNELHAQVKKHYHKSVVPKFTSKKVIGNLNKDFVTQRCGKLQAYLNEIAKLPHISEYNFMKNFLETSEVPHKNAFVQAPLSSPPPTNNNNSSFFSDSLYGSIGIKDSKDNNNGSSIFDSKLRTSSYALSDRSGEVSETASHMNSISSSEGKYTAKVLARIERANELLDLSGCSLETSLVGEIVTQNWVIALVRLDLSQNKLTSVPSLNHLTTLEHLNLSHNRINKLAEEIQKCVLLKSIELRHNALSKVPTIFHSFPKLTKLDLSHNNLNDISELHSLKQLIHLKLSGNLLGTLSPSISNLQSLETIELIGCSLVSLPDEFSSLTSLRQIDLTDNSLQELPSDIGQLINLTDLILDDNEIRDLPLGIGFCAKLETLTLDGNPVADSLLVEACNNGEIRNYLKLRIDSWKKDMSRLSMFQPRISTFVSKNAFNNEEDQEQEEQEEEEEEEKVETIEAKPPVQDPNASGDSKLSLIKSWAITQIMKKHLPMVEDLKIKFADLGPNSPINAVLKTLLDDIKELFMEASSHNYWIRVGQNLNLMRQTLPPEEKKGLPDVINVLKCIKQVLENSLIPQEVIQLVKVIKDFETIMQQADFENGEVKYRGKPRLSRYDWKY